MNVNLKLIYCPASQEWQWRHSYQELIIDRSRVHWSYPADIINTQVTYRFALAQVECTSKCYFCKQNMTSMSLTLAGQ